MIRDMDWPPPKSWTIVYISWDTMLANKSARAILDWIEGYQSHSRYQLRGPEDDPTSGFMFYFEDHRDATIFQLKWSP